jgi:hypothetical protein
MENKSGEYLWGQISSDEPFEEIEKNPQLIKMTYGELFLASCSNILRTGYGYLESIKKWGGIDADGNEIPVYTYPTIEYLNQFDYSNKRVFEFGSGGSTLYWMRRAKEVVSLENNREWTEKLTPQLSKNARVIHAEGKDYPLKIHEEAGSFDVIVVDSSGMRYDCAVEAIKKLSPGGMIILDNSDWHFNTASMLKKSGLLQVDMSGFKPLYSHTGTTSIFFHRDFDFPTVEDRQPSYAIGAKRIHSTHWDYPAN